MSDIFYAVQFIINDRSGTKPTLFDSKSDAVEYARLLENMSKDVDVKTEVRIYECKEISYK